MAANPRQTVRGCGRAGCILCPGDPIPEAPPREPTQEARPANMKELLFSLNNLVAEMRYETNLQLANARGENNALRYEIGQLRGEVGTLRQETKEMRAAMTGAVAPASVLKKLISDSHEKLTGDIRELKTPLGEISRNVARTSVKVGKLDGVVTKSIGTLDAVNRNTKGIPESARSTTSILYGIVGAMPLWYAARLMDMQDCVGLG